MIAIDRSTLSFQSIKHTLRSIATSARRGAMIIIKCNSRITVSVAEHRRLIMVSLLRIIYYYSIQCIKPKRKKI